MEPGAAGVDFVKRIDPVSLAHLPERITRCIKTQVDASFGCCFKRCFRFQISYFGEDFAMPTLTVTATTVIPVSFFHR
jgi:hypothetical protein